MYLGWFPCFQVGPLLLRTFIVSDKCPTLRDFWTRETSRDQTWAKNGDDYRSLSDFFLFGKEDVQRQANPISTSLGRDLPRDLLPVDLNQSVSNQPENALPVIAGSWDNTGHRSIFLESKHFAAAARKYFQPAWKRLFTTTAGARKSEIYRGFSGTFKSLVKVEYFSARI